MSLRSEHLHGVQSDHARRSRWEQSLVQFQCQMFVASWTGVVRYHGPRPVNRPNHVWVCNHTSMIDYIILCAYSPFAVIMQLHPGWVGFLQTQVLNCLGCLWFNRTEARPSIEPTSFLCFACCSMLQGCPKFAEVESPPVHRAPRSLFTMAAKQDSICV